MTLQRLPWANKPRNTTQTLGAWVSSCLTSVETSSTSRSGKGTSSSFRGQIRGGVRCCQGSQFEGAEQTGSLSFPETVFVFYAIQLERKKNLPQAKIVAKQLEADERKLHASLSVSIQKVLEGKNSWNLLHWRRKTCGLQHLGGDVLSKVHQADPEHIDHLLEVIQEDLDLGFLEGPFYDEQEVSTFLGRDDGSAIRRFMLVQRAEMKLRPIDDCLEAQLNFAYTSTSYLKLQDVDYIAGLALKLAAAVQGGTLFSGLASGLESAWILVRLTDRWLPFLSIAIWQLSFSMTIRGHHVSMCRIPWCSGRRRRCMRSTVWVVPCGFF